MSSNKRVSQDVVQRTEAGGGILGFLGFLSMLLLQAASYRMRWQHYPPVGTSDWSSLLLLDSYHQM